MTRRSITRFSLAGLAVAVGAALTGGSFSIVPERTRQSIIREALESPAAIPPEAISARAEEKLDARADAVLTSSLTTPPGVSGSDESRSAPLSDERVVTRAEEPRSSSRTARVPLGVPVEAETIFGTATLKMLEDDDNPLDLEFPSAELLVEHDSREVAAPWYESFLQTAPSFVGAGKGIAGVRLTNVPPDSFFDILGFRSGDIVRSVNSIEASRALEVPYMISLLSERKELFVMLERDGQDFGLAIHPETRVVEADDTAENPSNLSERAAARALLEVSSAHSTDAIAGADPVVLDMYLDMMGLPKL